MSRENQEMNNPLSIRDLALNGFMAGVAAADPYSAVQKALTKKSRLFLKDKNKLSSFNNRVSVITVGKAAVPMMLALYAQIPSKLLKQPGLVITNSENLSEDNIKKLNEVDQDLNIFEAGHPMPDENGVAATEFLMELLEQADACDLIIICVSGGASAMLPAPMDGISLADKKEITESLLASGADITEINIVRKHLSKIKGGGFVRQAAPAHIEAYILSDVIGDDLSAIASGPTVVDPSRYRDVNTILEKYALTQKIPQSIAQLIDNGIKEIVPETLKENDPEVELVQNNLIGSNIVSVQAVQSYLENKQVTILEAPYPLVGDVHDAAKICEQLYLQEVERYSKEQRPEKQLYALVTGGETTVQLKGSGRGGRNQEMSLIFAQNMTPHEDIAGDWVFLSGGTDGRDGPTDAAGGMVDAVTIQKIKAAGMSSQTELENNNAYEALEVSSDLILIGGTGTNVADLQILLFKI